MSALFEECIKFKEVITLAEKININLFEENVDKKLVELENCLDVLASRANDIDSRLNYKAVASIPSVGDLKRAQHVILNSNLFSIFNKDFRNQQQLVKSIGINPRDTYDVNHVLRDAIKLKEKLAELYNLSPETCYQIIHNKCFEEIKIS